MYKDEEQIRLLSIFHYVAGCLAALFSLFPVFHLMLGLFFLLAPQSFESHPDAPPRWFGLVFVIPAMMFILLGMTLAAFIIAAGRCLARRRRHMFCLVMAGIECIFMPFGTILGVFTIVVLMRESVKELFNANVPA